MESIFGLGGESPLRMLATLKNNLRRERRVFLTLFTLLVSTTACVTLMVLISLLVETLGREEQIGHAWKGDVNSIVGQRQNMLATARLLFLLGERGLLIRGDKGDKGDKSASAQLCTPAYPSIAGRPSLLKICNEIVGLLSQEGVLAPLQLLLVDGSAAYGYRLAATLPTGNTKDSAGAIRILTQAVFARMTALGVDPLIAERTRQMVWFKAPTGSGLKSSLLIGALLVASDDHPFVLMLTSIDLDDIGARPALNSVELERTVFDAGGNVVAGNLRPDEAGEIDAYLSARPGESFHWIPDYGWGMRDSSLISGFGHILLTVPYMRQLIMMRGKLLLVLLTTATLTALMLVMYRYWNHHFLTHTYRQATRAMEGEVLNHLLVHATPVGLCIVYRENLDIIVANKIARNMLGLGETGTRLPPQLCAEFEKRPVPDEQLEGGAKIVKFALSFECDKGRSAHLEVTYTLSVVTRQSVYFCAITDMAEHYEAERLLSEAKVRFFASMSHEIRTPLSSLVGNLELVAIGPLAPEQQARAQAMQASASGLLEVVNDVLDFSKIDVGEMRLVEEWGSVPELLARLVLAHAPLAIRQGLKLYVVVDRNVPRSLLFDQIRLSQIVNNLLSNAFKFTRSGKIVVRARWVAGVLEASVTDSGVGIPEDVKHRIFQPFTQGTAHSLTHARGTGLGLSICARLCELMQGKIAFESAVGVGTRITFALPLCASGDSAHADDLDLCDKNPAILCRAIEYRDWLTNLYDPKLSSPRVFAGRHEHIDRGQFDYLLVTDEFSKDEVRSIWGGLSQVVWVRQDGPLVPVLSDGGGVEVSVFTPTGIKSATRMLDSLPLPSKAGAKPLQAKMPRRHLGELTVLIAEDNRLNRSLLSDQLETLGSRVVAAVNGEEALGLLSRQPVDIVFTDMDMPVMNGSQLLAAVREMHSTMPVYAISASARHEDIEEGKALGFTDYLSKPVSLSVLSSVLDAMAFPDREASRETDDAEDIVLPQFPVLPLPYVETFVEQAYADLARFAEIAAERNITLLGRWAHGISGGLSVLGPSELYEHCQTLRQLIAATDSWSAEIDELAHEVAGSLAEMNVIYRAGQEGRSGMV